MPEFSKAVPGQPLHIRASEWNAVGDLVRQTRSREGATSFTRREPQASVVWVKNTSGADRSTGEPLGVDGPVFGPDDNLNEFVHRPTLKGATPTCSHAGGFVVLIEPVRNGEIGRAVICGLAVARVSISDESHRYADVDPDNAAQLRSIVAGSAAILWPTTPTPGLQWCLLSLSTAAGSCDESGGGGSGSDCCECCGGSGSGSGGSCTATAHTAITGVSRQGDNLVFTRANVSHDAQGCTTVESLSALTIDVCECGGSGSGSGSGGSGGGGEFGDCAGCSGEPPSTLVVDNPNVSNAGCSGAAEVNDLTNRTMARVSDCRWEGPLFTACENEEARWSLTFASGNWTLLLEDTVCSYTASGEQDCGGFTLSGGSGSEFSGWPATLGVS